MVDYVLLSKPFCKPSFRSFSFLLLKVGNTPFLLCSCWSVSSVDMLRKQQSWELKRHFIWKWNMHLAEWLCSVVSDGLNKMNRRLRLGGGYRNGPILSWPLQSWPFSSSPWKGCDCSICLCLPSLQTKNTEKLKDRFKVNICALTT